MRHATDADHVVAVSTIVAHERSLWRASRVGAVWGLGHTLTIFLIGGAIIVFKLAFTPRLGLSMEMTVALMLVVLGTLNLFDVRVGGGRPATVRPFLVGAVHGMAGSAAATLLILPLIEDARWAALYLVVFGAGTMAGMALITAAIAAPSLYRPKRMKSLERSIRLASGAVSVTFGLYLGYKIGFVDGLFLGHSQWTPR
jgi:hypothetical protein